MNANIVLDMINHLNKNTVTLPGHDSRAWKLSINGYDALGMTQSRHILHCDLKKKCDMEIISQEREYIIWTVTLAS